MTASEQETAYHETGHYVAGYVLGLSDHHITIEADEESESLGSVGGEDPFASPDPGDEEVRDYVVSLFAGFEAELRFNPEADAAGSRSDTEKARTWLARIASEAEEAALRERARALVEEHWEKIERLVPAVLRYRTLYGDEADIVIEEGVEELETYFRSFPAARKGRGPA